jgi:triosephosphate isomerase (TIM)
MVANRPYIIIGNWKMHKTIEEGRSFVRDLLSSFKPMKRTIVGLAVPFTEIYPLAEEAKGTPLLIGAQNMNDASEGAFTGEIAGSMLKDAGAHFVLLGHSERRHLYCEDDALINRKVKQAVKKELRPILCVGETGKEYEANETHSVIERQLTEGLKDLQPHQLHNLIIAYEPVWAIGNGHSATPSIAQEVQQFCRQILAKILTEELAQELVIQYGGSVNPGNAQELLAQPDIDGLLIGGASLSLESFRQIVNDRYLKNQVEG